MMALQNGVKKIAEESEDLVVPDLIPVVPNTRK